MIVDTEFLDTLGTRIDQSQSMLLPGCEFKFGKTGVIRARRAISHEGAIVIHLSINQIVDRFRGYLREIRTHDIFYNVKVRLVIIIR